MPEQTDSNTVAVTPTPSNMPNYSFEEALAVLKDSQDIVRELEINREKVKKEMRRMMQGKGYSYRTSDVISSFRSFVDSGVLDIYDEIDVPKSAQDIHAKKMLIGGTWSNLLANEDICEFLSSNIYDAAGVLLRELVEYYKENREEALRKLPIRKFSKEATDGAVAECKELILKHEDLWALIQLEQTRERDINRFISTCERISRIQSEIMVDEDED